MQDTHRIWHFSLDGRPMSTTTVAELEIDGRRAVAFLERPDNLGQSVASAWPEIGAIYARERGLDPAATLWFEVCAGRLPGGELDVSRYCYCGSAAEGDTEFVADQSLANRIARALGLDPDSFPTERHPAA